MLSGIFWVLIVLAVLIISKKNKRAQLFKDKMISMWKYSLVIALVGYISAVIGSGHFSSLLAVWVPLFLFCRCIVGFALAKSIQGYEPLPVTKAFIEHDHQWRKLFIMFMVGLLTTVVVVLLDQFIPTFGENNTTSSMSMLHLNKGLLFFIFLYGAGIAEETVYRLIFLSLIWKLTTKRWLSIVLSALLFGIYHLTPLNSMYKVYWGFPIYQFVCATISGIVFGYIYTKRGYETAVIGHTFSDWLPVLIFMK
ncbi:CPBP family intramembrane metalloprotease (plasmid) [Clostridium estertheticum]|uniref:CPBP family intramembrane glutamic endopeptidase n=1 Tax=Clostridium estertheticum TaxID=238834 RepID=UPI001C7CAE75|nr:CPBP family intramembrane glutamic endopeptidase [Clostridium estertheticum]MBX4262766.1 CPBP family intramembrane metalloprotease [Clostridium estertheticum]WLC72803.1 CPBP family intramembrane metalloprotease [Clostridium estertheticum]